MSTPSKRGIGKLSGTNQIYFVIHLELNQQIEFNAWVWSTAKPPALPALTQSLDSPDNGTSSTALLALPLFMPRIVA
jgi:uncharacterized lipoprotein YddW (UPF0748 family)